MKLTVRISRSFAALALLGGVTLGCEKFATCEQTKTCAEGEGGAGGEGSASSSGGAKGTEPGSGGTDASGGNASGGETSASGGQSNESGGTSSASCDPGEYKSGDACEPCEDGTFSTESDAEACVAWTVCVTGLVETEAGTKTSDRVCEVVEFVRRFGVDSSVTVAGIHHTAGTTRILVNEGSVSTGDAFIRSFDLLGAVGTEITGSTSGLVQGNGLVVGSDGGLLWAGSADLNFAGTQVGSRDAWVRVYGSGGSITWDEQLGTTGLDEGLAVAKDTSGNVYVAGGVSGDFGATSAGNSDGFVRKYGSTGVAGWTHQFGTSGNDRVVSVRVHTNGEIIVAGEVEGGLPGVSGKGSKDWVVRRLSSTGSVLGTAILGTSMSDSLNGMELGPSGEIVLFGDTMGAYPGETRSGSGSDTDALVVVLTGSLVEQWADQFGTSSTDRASGVAFDSKGSFLVAGITSGALPGTTDLTGSDFFVRKVSPTGTFDSNRIFGTTSSEIGVASIAVDAQDGILLAGVTSGTFAGSSGSGKGFLLRARP